MYLQSATLVGESPNVKMSSPTKNLNLERWQELVTQSWVPFNASVGGKQYDLAKLGYRDFRVDKTENLQYTHY